MLPSSLTLPPPDSTNSSFDQCNLMDGVYQCSYHSLFDCDPDINIFYTWSTNDLDDLQTITAEFTDLVQTVNVMAQSLEAMQTTVRVEFDYRRTGETNGPRIQMSTSLRGSRIFTGILRSDADQINTTIGTSSTVTIRRIIFCAENG